MFLLVFININSNGFQYANFTHTSLLLFIFSHLPQPFFSLPASFFPRSPHVPLHSLTLSIFSFSFFPLFESPLGLSFTSHGTISIFMIYILTEYKYMYAFINVESTYGKNCIVYVLLILRFLIMAIFSFIIFLKMS